MVTAAVGLVAPQQRDNALVGRKAGRHYHGAAMNDGNAKSDQILAGMEAELHGAAARLKEMLAQTARSLKPFPAFMGMVSLQAVEIEPPFRGLKDRGCVVVLPDGQICELALRVVPGAPGVTDVDQLEEFEELDLPAEEYVIYAAAAIRVLCSELNRRR